MTAKSLIQLNETLPIFSVIDEIRQTLSAHNRVILQAEPGAGKSTQVPLALLNEAWLEGQKIIMLEPRRLAARSIAGYLAGQLNEPVGERVGYHIRNEHKVSQKTRLEVVTEGILTRRLQQDPELAKTALIIFDEFHERSINADLSLALCLDIQAAFREDLKILVMSATLESEKLSEFLEAAPVIHCKGRHFPVETHYLKSPLKTYFLPSLVNTLKKALLSTQGDILIFLPGQREIYQAINAVKNSESVDFTNFDKLVLLPLFGSLNVKEQQKAFEMTRPGKNEQRKVIFATNIAETSLTLPNITCVIDTGLERQTQYDPTSGMTRLTTQKISKASAEQRRGRAGRVCAGTCYRLWTESQQNQLIEFTSEEITRSDLTPLCLETALWGAPNIDDLNWLTSPPKAHFDQSKSLLQDLELLSKKGTINPAGSQAVQLGLHPRLARLLLKAQQLDLSSKSENADAPFPLLPLACQLAAILAEQDIFSQTRDHYNADILGRLKYFQTQVKQPLNPNHGLNKQPSYVQKNALKQALLNYQNWFKKLNDKNQPIPNLQNDNTAFIEQYAGLLVAFAFPDRIAKRRQGSDPRYLLSNGKGACLSNEDNLRDEPFLVASNLDGQVKEGRIYLACPVDPAQIKQFFHSQITQEIIYQYLPDKQVITAKKQRKFHALVLEEMRLEPEEFQQTAFLACLKQALIQTNLQILPWHKNLKNWLERVRWLKQYQSTLPDIGDDALLKSLNDWLFPFLTDIRNVSDLKKLDLKSILAGQLNYETTQKIEAEAPTLYKSPSGQEFPIHYETGRSPYVSVPLQSVFGELKSPRLGFNQIALTFELLSPARRPIQVTDDLANFWVTSYIEVAKEMRGRYPKHRWPEKPLEEKAGRSIKHKKTKT